MEKKEANYLRNEIIENQYVDFIKNHKDFEITSREWELIRDYSQLPQFTMTDIARGFGLTAPQAKKIIEDVIKRIEEYKKADV